MAKLRFNLPGRSIKLPSNLYTFEPTHASRYWILASLLGEIDDPKKLRILDVGGKKGLLRFFPGFNPTILDIEESNEPNFVQGDALHMPFKDNDFDCVISCDVLEHIPKADRKQFILEMLRVSKWGVIFCAPFDNEGVGAAEKDANTYYKHLSGIDHRWLKEHIDNGLPNEASIEKILQEHKYNYAKFHHLSLDVWRSIVKLHLFQTTFHENESLTKMVMSLYKKYYTELCQLDYAENGYRTFFVISKTGQVDINLPDPNVGKAARMQYMENALKGTLDILEGEFQDHKHSEEVHVKQKAAYESEKQKLDAELQAILASRRWKMATKLANIKAVLSGKRS
jgi:SAM-dependent methyltransferase